MKVRICTAIVGIIAVLVLVWLGSWPFTAACVAAGIISFREYARMMKEIDVHTFSKSAYAAIIIMLCASGFYSVPVVFAAVCLCFIVMFMICLRVQFQQMQDLFYTILGTLYVGIGLGSLVLLRGGSHLIPSGVEKLDPGIFLILFALIGTWASDSFAYFAGKKFGKTHMAPHISPKKTLEGLIGGAAGAIICCILFSVYAGYPVIYGGILGIVLSIVAPIGDLFESYMKRVCGIKDSGNLLPGHGGMLDRFDSMYFVAPVMVSLLVLIHQL